MKAVKLKEVDKEAEGDAKEERLLARAESNDS